MKLLVVTQKIDVVDPGLGFFVSWVEELSKRFAKVTVICLERGNHSLPKSVKVLSLGKEAKRTRFGYVSKFYRYVWREKNNHDLVFVHMNQEYVLLAGCWWRLWGKKIMFWRNHPKGGLLTRIAVFLSHRVFCTSSFSYTAQFKKTVLMPVGIDVEKFRPQSKNTKVDKKILFLGRLSPIKRVDLFIEALKDLAHQGVDFQAAIVGSPANKNDANYEKKLHEMGKGLVKDGKLTFSKSVSPKETPVIYNQHEVYINLTPTGSFDKTILEAMACGTLVLISNQSLEGHLPNECVITSQSEFAQKLISLLNLSPESKAQLRQKTRQLVVDHHSLAALMDKFVSYSQML